MNQYGIGDRTPFINERRSLSASRENSALFGLGGKKYYSSIDAEIYFGNYYVDEVVTIAFSVDQQTMPLFGFNSYVYDEMALGSRIITGQFVVNYTEANYLPLLLDKLESDGYATIKTDAIEKEDDGAEVTEVTAGSVKTGSNAGTTKDYRDLKANRKPRWHTGFDIDVMIGSDDSLGNLAGHCMLEGVYIMGSSIQLSPSGQPITEMYSFIAKDIKTIN